MANNCGRCGGIGYTEYSTARGGGFSSVLQQCCDVAEYSREVQRRKHLYEQAAHVIAEHERKTGKQARGIEIDWDRTPKLPGNVIPICFKRKR